MSNVTNTGDIFAAFIEADKAIKELPAVREELELTKVDLELTKGDLDTTKGKVDLLSGTIDALRAELAQKEAALAEAMFLRKDAESKLAAIASILPSRDPVPAAGPSVEAVTTNNQKDSSVADPINATIRDGVGDEESSAIAQPLTELSATSSEGQRDTDPTVTASHPVNESSGKPAVTPSGSKEPNPTEVANSATPDVNPISSLSTQADPVHNQSGPTANYGTPVPTPTNAPTTNAGSADRKLPHEGQPYWMKPTSMALTEFQSLGGIVPEWMLPRDVA